MVKNILFLISAFLVFSTAVSCQEPAPVIDSRQMSADMSSDSVIILDVRTPEEFAEGHIPGAINIDYRNENFSVALDTLDRNMQYNVYCRSGGRSTNASTLMKEKGFKVVNYEGSLNDWKNNGKLLER